MKRSILRVLAVTSVLALLLTVSAAEAAVRADLTPNLKDAVESKCLYHHL